MPAERQQKPDPHSPHSSPHQIASVDRHHRREQEEWAQPANPASAKNIAFSRAEQGFLANPACDTDMNKPGLPRESMTACVCRSNSVPALSAMRSRWKRSEVHHSPPLLGNASNRSIGDRPPKSLKKVLPSTSRQAVESVIQIRGDQRKCPARMTIGRPTQKREDEQHSQR